MSSYDRHDPANKRMRPQKLATPVASEEPAITAEELAIKNFMAATAEFSGDDVDHSQGLSMDAHGCAWKAADNHGIMDNLRKTWM